MTLDTALLERFLADLLGRGLAPTSVGLRRQRLEPAIAWLHEQGVRDAAALTPEDIDRFFVHLNERGLARWTLKSYRSSLRAFGRWLAAQNLILADPTEDLGPLCSRRAEELPPMPLSVIEMEQLLSAIEVPDVIGLRNRAHTELLYATGMRLGESLRLQLGDIDLTLATVRIQGKGGHQRVLPLLPGVLAALADYRAQRRQLLRGPDHGALFLGHDGKRLRHTAYREWLRRLARRVFGADRRVTPHLIRHTFAVHLLLGKADIRSVQQLLGHLDLDTTAIYLRLLPEDLRAAYEQAMPVLLATTGVWEADTGG